MAEVCDICTGDYTWAEEPGSGVKSIQRNKNLGLLAAARVGHKKCADILIKEGADVNYSTGWFRSKYRQKIRQKAGFAKKLKVDYSAVNDGTPLFHAITYNQIEITKLLVKEGPDVNLVKNNRTVLSMAAERGKIEYVELLIEAESDVNQRAVPPLGCVVRTFSQFPSVNKGRCIDVLIKAGADVNTPLVNCAGACSSRVLAILLNAGADVKLFPFHEVVGLDHKLDCVKLLIQKGADVNKQNNCGETPVYKAASLCDKTYLKLLVNSGADVNIPNNHGVTPLMEVAEKGSRIIEELVTAIQNPTNCTHPANIRYIELIRILLKFGARINCKDELEEMLLNLPASTLVQRIT